jgi:glycine cleavage system H protein
VEIRVSDIPSDLLFTEEHEYVKRTDESDVVLIGITDYAQGELGDVVYVELPKEGDDFGRSDVFGTLEAVKAVTELFAPLGGEVEEVNTRLDKEPGLVNSDPYGDGWMIRLRVKNAAELDELLGPDEYAQHVGE